MVELAISEGVHAVLLADVIDQSNRIFESQGPLKRALNNWHRLESLRLQ